MLSFRLGASSWRTLSVAACMLAGVSLTWAMPVSVAGATGPVGVVGPTGQSASMAKLDGPLNSPLSASLDPAQKAVLARIGARTWKFFEADVNTSTNLPMDNVSLVGGAASGAYTSPTDIGVYMWGVTAARDLHLVSAPKAEQLVAATLTAASKLRNWNGFLLSWYDTNTGQAITGPGGTALGGGSLDGQFISTVDNAWYANSLVVVRQAYPQLAPLATKMLNAMNFAILYDSAALSSSTNAGQMYGGYVVGQGPTGWTYGLLNTETRIAAYMGIGTQTVPGTVWWRTFRTLPASLTWQTQTPQGSYVTYRDPQSGQQFKVFEGHYNFAGVKFVPSWGGSEFEGLMNSMVVPETSWGPNSFGLNDRNYAVASIAYASSVLHYPVWGLSPASTPDNTGGYAAYGVPALSSNAGCCPYQTGAVTPYASFLALSVIPKRAYANISAMRSDFPQVYGPMGYFDSLNPTSGQVAQRYLVLDQAMVMAGIDVVLNNGGLQHYFARDAVGRAVRPYLAMEHFSIAPSALGK